MAGNTGERPLGDIITDVEFWKLHFVNIPAIFISGFLFVSTGLAYDVFGTPRPNEYFRGASLEMPIVTQRKDVKGQLKQLIQERQKTAPDIND